MKTTHKEYLSNSAPTSRNTDHWSVQDGAPALESENEQAARERRVTTLRSWLDTLPDVLPVPAPAIDRSELY